MAEEKKVEPLVERQRRESAKAEGGEVEAGRPPVWMTTYSDLTNLLMTFFVLWYALTIMKIPLDLWRFKVRGDEATPVRGEEKKYHRGPTNLLEDTIIWKQIQQMSQEEKIALSELKTLREKAIDVRDYLEQGKLEEGVKVKVMGEDVVIIPSAPLLFAEGSDVIKESFYPVLDKIASQMKAVGASVRIEGHTDDTPIHPRHQERFPTNYELSAARAISVANYFINQHQIPPERITVAGYGPLRPKYPNTDPEKKALNRRVEFHISVSSEEKAKEG